MRFFGSKDTKTDDKILVGDRVPRYSSAWSQLLKELKQGEGLRVLDFGPTSPNNINFITALGHSIYTSSLVDEAVDPKWMMTGELFEQSSFDVHGFMQDNLDFGDRKFDVVLFWDTAGLIPPSLVEAVIDRLYEVTNPGARLLAFFPAQKQNANYMRFHLRDDEYVDAQRAGDHPIQGVYNTRQVEKLFAKFAAYRFFLAKDNLREVLVTR
jgi:hypothetical protein